MHALGGLGLFLLGMIILTDGLRALAGDAMRAFLTRFTKSPLSGAATGVAATAILQSSSATTVAAVGFVGAGLLTFPQALGIIFGANIGSTFTGWIVALLGFKLNLGEIVLPFIFAGVVLRMFGKGRVSQSGYALAGFGVIFVGIGTLQAAMEGFTDILTPDRLPGDSWAGVLALVGMGMVATIITQSSAVGVAAALTALHADAITFPQAAALVVGMDIGTTATAAMASFGGSVGARRTGLSHVIYNLLTGVGAMLLIQPYIAAWDWIAPGRLADNAEVALVAFHTSFNTLGVVVILPFAQPFARLIERIVPDRPQLYTRTLDSAFLEDATLALNAVQETMQVTFIALLRHINAMLGETEEGRRSDLDELERALDQTHAYLDQVRVALQEGPLWDRYLASLHALDHLQRLHGRCEEQEDRAATAQSISELADECALLTGAICNVIDDIHNKRWFDADKHTAEVSQRIVAEVQPFRSTVIAQIARDEIGVPEGTRKLDAIRWLERVSKHVDKITHYTAQAVLAAGT